MTRSPSALRQLLVVARDFPPAGGAPAIRISKLAKYLPDFGWQAVIVTAPADHAWVRDDSLLSEVAEDLTIHRVPRLLSGAVRPGGVVSRAQKEVRAGRLQRAAAVALVPDRSILWAIPALRATRALQHHADALLTSAPPFSTHLVGIGASPRIPWVADFRDNWSTNPDYRGPVPLRAVYRLLERTVLRRAQAILAMSEEARDELASVVPSARSKMLIAPNGYDPVDLPAESSRPTNFSLVYAGSIRSTRNPRPLLLALSDLVKGDAAFASSFEFQAFGTIPESTATMARSLLAPDRVKIGGFIPHREALQRASRGAVLVAISSQAEAGTSALTSKLLEYLALRRPVLYLAPPGPGARLVQELDAGQVAPTDDVQAIRRAVTVLFRQWRRGEEHVAEGTAIHEFDRREVARVIAKRLDGLVAHTRPTGLKG